MNPINDLRYGHFWSKLPQANFALTGRFSKVIIDAEFEEDFTGAEYQDKGKHVPRMGSNRRPKA